jgi:hypothetical protein
MSPKLPDLLAGLAQAAMTPAPPEACGDYAAARMGLIATLLVLAAQEAERGPAARQWENDAIAALLIETRDLYGQAWAGSVDPAAAPAGAEATWSVLDARNADLRRALIALHEAAEARRDASLQRRILALYEAMAHARRLELGAG